MRVLVTGGGGLLGSVLLRQAPPGVELHATVRRSPAEGAEAHRVELCDPAAVRGAWRRVRPDVVLHTAYDPAATAAQVEAATAAVARACAEQGAGLVHLSTDLVFDGEHAPYAEDRAPAPVHEYGRRKAAAERTVREAVPEAAVVRTSLLVRTDPPDRTTRWVLEGLRGGGPLRLFHDELRTPIAVEELAAQLWEVALLPAGERRGAWHLAGPEAVSRYALGLLIAARWGLDPRGIVPTPAAAFPEPRPRDARLLTPRADRTLRTRARPVSAVLAPEFAGGGGSG